MDKIPKDLVAEIIALLGEVGVEVKYADRQALQPITTTDVFVLATNDSLFNTKLDGVVDPEDNLSIL